MDELPHKKPQKPSTDKTLESKKKKKVTKKQVAKLPPIVATTPPYSIIADLQNQKADITIAQLLKSVPKLRAELSRGLRRSMPKSAKLAEHLYNRSLRS